MGKLDIYYYMQDLKNVNEKRVWEMLSNYVEAHEQEMCVCAICLTDIAAITLNNIAPHYQTEENLIFAQEKVPDEEIYRQMRRAMQIVIERPHH